MSFHDTRLTKSQLSRVSPWTYAQIAAIEDTDLRQALVEISGREDQSYSLRTWVRAAERCHSPLWRAIDALG